MARTYKRDSRGRFAGGGGGSSRGGGRKPLQRGTNRLTRDNAGRITSVGGDGATARGGRLRTASGRQRATVTARGIGKAPAGTVSRSGGRAKAAKQSEATVMGGTSRVPAARRPGSMTSTLRSTLQSLAQADARRIREIEAITGQPVRAPRRASAGQGATVRAPGRRSVSGTLRDNLRALAQSDARTTRGMADLTKPAPAGAIKGGTSRKALKASAKALPAAKPAAAAKPARVAQGAGRGTVAANRTPKPRTMSTKARTGADLVRRFERLNDGSIAKGNPTATSPVTRRQRALRNATDPAARRTAQRKLDRAMATQSRAIGFRNAMAETRLGYSGRVKTKEGQDTLAGNFAKRPRYSTKQRIRPSWAR